MGNEAIPKSKSLKINRIIWFFSMYFYGGIENSVWLLRWSYTYVCQPYTYVFGEQPGFYVSTSFDPFLNYYYSILVVLISKIFY